MVPRLVAQAGSLPFRRLAVGVAFTYASLRRFLQSTFNIEQPTFNDLRSFIRS